MRDALIIQSLSLKTGSAPIATQDNLCGQCGFGTGAAVACNAPAQKTLCSKYFLVFTHQAYTHLRLLEKFLFLRNYSPKFVTDLLNFAIF